MILADSLLWTLVVYVFSVTDSTDNKWSIIVPSKRSIIDISDVDDKEEYDEFEDIQPFTYP